jgi:hypothetical protein
MYVRTYVATYGRDPYSSQQKVILFRVRVREHYDDDVARGGIGPPPSPPARAASPPPPTARGGGIARDRRHPCPRLTQILKPSETL